MRKDERKPEVENTHMAKGKGLREERMNSGNGSEVESKGLELTEEKEESKRWPSFYPEA